MYVIYKFLKKFEMMSTCTLKLDEYLVSVLHDR